MDKPNQDAKPSRKHFLIFLVVGAVILLTVVVALYLIKKDLQAQNAAYGAMTARITIIENRVDVVNRNIGSVIAELERQGVIRQQNFDSSVRLTQQQSRVYLGKLQTVERKLNGLVGEMREIVKSQPLQLGNIDALRVKLVWVQAALDKSMVAINGLQDSMNNAASENETAFKDAKNQLNELSESVQKVKELVDSRKEKK